jgi:hypothetical protein
MKPKSIILLQALLAGERCKIGNYVYCFSDDNRLCVVGMNETENKEVLLAVNFGDVNIQDFIGLAETMTPNEITVIAANAVLHSGGF